MQPLIIFIFLILTFTACSKPSSQTPITEITKPAQNGWEPRQACGFLSDQLSPGNYVHEGNNIFGCMSGARNMGAGAPPNNIVYRVRGDAARARQIDLVVNINNIEGEADARKVFLDYAQELSQKALNIPLSSAAVSAITAGQTGQGRVDTTKVEVLRHDFSNGKGYELHYVITPRL